jgi:multiple antibiotic resistance protein
VLSIGEVFTLFFITLGPMKLLGPFAQQTRNLDSAALRAMAWRVFLIGTVAVLIGGYVGTALALKWNLSLPALLIATGIIFFLVAIKVVMAPYSSVHQTTEPLPEKPMVAALQLTFPLVVSPYGIAALIAIFAGEGNPGIEKQIYLALLGVMALNLLSMLFIRHIMRPSVLLVLQIVGAVLGVLQVCLAVQIILRAFRELHLLA